MRGDNITKLFSQNTDCESFEVWNYGLSYELREKIVVLLFCNT